MISPKLVDVGRHLNIKLITNAELQEVSGEAGKFRVKILRKPRYIDTDKCTGCGLCAQSELSPDLMKELEGELWVDRIKINEQACIQCGDCADACKEENKSTQAITNISIMRKELLEAIPGEKAAQEILMHEIVRMNIGERQNFWKQQFKKCIKCYGCREVCPVCICNECELDNPDWVTSGKIPPDYPLFHLIRAYHLADICIGCGACEATCPMRIPLLTIMHMVRIDREKIFDYVPGLSSEWKNKIIERTRKQPIATRKVKV